MKKKKYRYVLLLTVLLSALVYFESCSVKNSSQKSYLVNSDSMMPAIYPGDYIIGDSVIVSLDYGDIVGIKHRDDFTGEPYLDVLRVVGLPGDSVGLVDNIVYINERICSNKYVRDVDYDIYSFYEYEETLLNNLTIKIFKGEYDREGDSAPSVYVPTDCYYLLGDCRSLSMDSRYYGPFPKSKIIGKIVEIKSMH